MRYRIDLRSDIHTVPTPAMHQAMAEAALGGDALADEDPATRELEETCAKMFGREAGLLVTSGTMGNLVSLLTLTRPGWALIADPYTHVVSSEGHGFERLAGCTPHLVQTDGALTGDQLRRCLREASVADGAAIVCVENTHSLRGGKAWGADVMAGLVAVRQERRLMLHVDGARIFNASVALGQSVAELTAGADTVQVCLAKGLGAPVGSVIVGSDEIIAEARKSRQMVGGGLHKPGAIAAAGLVALREMPARLTDDHRRARRLGELLSQVPPLRLAYPVFTNIVDLFYVPESLRGRELVAVLAARGIGVAGPWDSPHGQWLRFVTHDGVTDADVEEVVDAVGNAMPTCLRGCAVSKEYGRRSPPS